MPKRPSRITASIFPDRRFPLEVRKAPHHGATELHGHDFHELVVILAGHGRHITERETYPISAGDAFLLAGEERHGYADTRDLTLVNILFDPQRLHLPLADVGDIPGYQALFRVEPVLRARDRLRSRLQLKPEELAVAAQMIERLQSELRHGRPGYRFAACACLMDLILYLSRCYTESSAPEGDAILRIGAVLSHIEKRFAEPIRVSELARLAHMSESTLLRTFRRVMGTSPLDHVIRVRVGRAMELLRQEDVRVTEAAFQCGFRDSNYFARQFRQVTGRTPRQFQKTTRV
jgi:AraC family L-rhamnose operon transcriptional activator RhaR/AraC family L-rhamnose operon regulatory protein RhaS